MEKSQNILNERFIKKIESNLRDIIINRDEHLPPVQNWNPDKKTDIDIKIDAKGQWYYQNSLIKRKRLVQLFAKILRKEHDQQYYLVTPVEKMKIEVENVPFVIVAMHEKIYQNFNIIIFVTNVGDLVELKNRDDFRTQKVNDTVIPYIKVKNQIEAVVSRPVFYQLAEKIKQNMYQKKLYYGIWSNQKFFPIQQVEKTEA